MKLQGISERQNAITGAGTEPVGANILIFQNREEKLLSATPRQTKEVMAKRKSQGSRILRSHYTWNLLQVETGHQVLQLFPIVSFPAQCLSCNKAKISHPHPNTESLEDSCARITLCVEKPSLSQVSFCRDGLSQDRSPNVSVDTKPGHKQEATQELSSGRGCSALSCLCRQSLPGASFH